MLRKLISKTSFKKIAAGTAATATTTLIYDHTKQRTPTTPFSYIQLMHAMFLDENQKRAKGMAPGDFYKAGLFALIKNDSEGAYTQFGYMASFHPIDSAEQEMYAEAAAMLFEDNRVEEAVKLWRRYYKNEKEALSYTLEMAADKLFLLGKSKKGFDYLEEVERNGYLSYLSRPKLAYHYLSSDNAYDLKCALHHFKVIAEVDSRHAVNQNELGVAQLILAMNEDNQFETWQAQAILSFNKALQLDPENQLIKTNLRMAEILTAYADYDKPQLHLEWVEGKPTSLFNAVCQSLLGHVETCEMKGKIGLSEKSAYYGESGISPVVTFTPLKTFSSANATTLIQLKQLEKQLETEWKEAQNKGNNNQTTLDNKSVRRPS